MILGWILSNYEWLFSGLGVLFLSLLATIFLKSSGSPKQIQNVGDNSDAKQAGRDISSSN